MSKRACWVVECRQPNDAWEIMDYDDCSVSFTLKRKAFIQAQRWRDLNPSMEWRIALYTSAGPIQRLDMSPEEEDQ